MTQISLQFQGLTINVTRSRIPPEASAHIAASGARAGPASPPSGLGSYPNPGPASSASPGTPDLGLGPVPSPLPADRAFTSLPRSGLGAVPNPEPVCSASPSHPFLGTSGSPDPEPVCTELGLGSSTPLSADLPSSQTPVPLAGPCGPGFSEPSESDFPPVPSAWLAASKSLRAAGFSGEDRVKRAWVAGCWAREVLAGRAKTPKPTPRISLANRFYAVARSANGSPPELYRSQHDYLIAVGSQQDCASLSQAFPSELECRVYLDGAGIINYLPGP